MPQLGEGVFAPVLSHYILKVTFHGTGTSSNPSLRAYITSFIRILDKTIHEYDQSRKELQAYIGSANKTMLIMKAVSHLETCVNSLRRCLRLLDRMKTFNLGDSDEARLFRRSVQATSRAVPDVRNAIEHMDEKIARGEVTEGQPIALMISEVGDRACIAGEEILFSDLASTIRKLHAFAVQLCDYRDPVVNPEGDASAVQQAADHHPVRPEKSSNGSCR